MLRGAGHLGGILKIALCASFSLICFNRWSFLCLGSSYLENIKANDLLPHQEGSGEWDTPANKSLKKGDRWRNVKSLMYCCSPLSNMNDLWNIYHQNHCPHVGDATHSLDSITAFLLHWAGNAAADLEERKASHMKAGFNFSTFPQQWQGVQLVMRVY